MTRGEWREGQRDDLVLAVALAAWLGENGVTVGTLFEPRLVHGLDVNNRVDDDRLFRMLDSDDPDEWDWLT